MHIFCFNLQDDDKLLPNSLVCLSSDNFNTIIIATVTGPRDSEQLANGCFEIKFEDTNYKLGIRRIAFVMLES